MIHVLLLTLFINGLFNSQHGRKGVVFVEQERATVMGMIRFSSQNSQQSRDGAQYNAVVCCIQITQREFRAL